MVSTDAMINYAGLGPDFRRQPGKYGPEAGRPVDHSVPDVLDDRGQRIEDSIADEVDEPRRERGRLLIYDLGSGLNGSVRPVLPVSWQLRQRTVIPLVRRSHGQPDVVGHEDGRSLFLQPYYTSSLVLAGHGGVLVRRDVDPRYVFPSDVLWFKKRYSSFTPSLSIRTRSGLETYSVCTIIIGTIRLPKNPYIRRSGFGTMIYN